MTIRGAVKAKSGRSGPCQRAAHYAACLPIPLLISPSPPEFSNAVLFLVAKVSEAILLSVLLGALAEIALFIRASMWFPTPLQVSAAMLSARRVVQGGGSEALSGQPKPCSSRLLRLGAGQPQVSLFLFFFLPRSPLCIKRRKYVAAEPYKRPDQYGSHGIHMHTHTPTWPAVLPNLVSDDRGMTMVHDGKE